jgi:hypothetical protein
LISGISRANHSIPAPTVEEYAKRYLTFLASLRSDHDAGTGDHDALEHVTTTGVN